MLGLVAGLSLALLAGRPAAAQDIEILATDPSAGATLAVGEPLYARIRYASDRPLRFGMRGVFRGAELSSRTSTSPVYPAGSGEALAWIELVEPVDIDGLRLRVYDERWQPLLEIERPLTLAWRAGARTNQRMAASWVSSLSAVQQQMTSAQLSQPSASSSGSGLFWDLIVMLMGWSVPGYLVLQLYVWLRWSGGWRTAGLLPLVFTVPILAYTVMALLAGSNVWPLIMLFTYPLAFLYLVAVMIGKWIGIDRAPSASAAR